MTRILLVEDDRKLAAALIDALERYQITTPHVTRGHSVVEGMQGVELVLLDLSLPDMDGLAVCRQIRAVSNVPIIILTGRASTDDRVQGLHAGADDYVVKPVSTAELVARIRAVLRRYPPVLAQLRTIRVKDVDIDLMRQTVTVAMTRVTLSRREFQILAHIAEEGGGVCSRDLLVREIWGRPWQGAYSTLNVHVAALRSKIGRPELVETVRGVGYRLGIE